MFQIGGVEAHATRTGRVVAGTVIAKEIAVSRDGHEWRRSADARVEIDLQDTSGAARLRSARIRVGRSLVEVTGEIQQLNPLVAQAHVALPRGLDLVRAFAADLSAEGEISANADFVADRSGHRATIRAEATAVRVAQIGPWDGRIHAHLESDVLRVDDIDLSAYGGSIRGSGAVSFGNAASDLRLQVRGIDIANVLASHTDLSVRVGSRVDADLVMRLPQRDLRTLTTEATVAFRPLPGAGLPLRGSATLMMFDRNVHVSSGTFAVRDADLRLHGAVGLDGQVQLRYGMHLPDLVGMNVLLADAGLTMPRVNLRGALRAEGIVEGSFASWMATATIASRRFAIEEIDLDVESELRLTPARVDLVRLNAKGVDGALSARGVIPVSGTESWNVAGQIQQLRLTDLLTSRSVPIDATSSGHFDVTGRRGDPEVTFTIEAAGSRLGAPLGTDDGSAAQARIETSGHASRRAVVIDRFKAREGAGTIEGHGRWVPLTGGIAARVRVADLHVSAASRLLRITNLESVLAGELEVSGTLAAPQGRGHLSATRTQWRAARLPDFHVALSSDGRTVNLEGRAAQRLLLTGKLTAGTPWPLRLDIDLGAFPLADVMRVLPKVSERGAWTAVSGRLLVDLELAAPSSVRYEAYSRERGGAVHRTLEGRTVFAARKSGRCFR